MLDHSVEYSELPAGPDYRSSAEFDPRGMEHVYFIVNTFLDLILRDEVLPKSKLAVIHHNYGPWKFSDYHELFSFDVA